MEYHVYWSLKSSCFKLFGDEKYGIFSGKKLMEIWFLLITEKFLFWPFQWWEIRSFLSQKVDGKIIFSGYWEVLVLNFSLMGNTVFFSAKMLMERYLHGLFELSVIFQDLRNMVFHKVGYEYCWIWYRLIKVWMAKWWRVWCHWQQCANFCVWWLWVVCPCLRKGL